LHHGSRQWRLGPELARGMRRVPLHPLHGLAVGDLAGFGFAVAQGSTSTVRSANPFKR
jgi:hypothetical protein